MIFRWGSKRSSYACSRGLAGTPALANFFLDYGVRLRALLDQTGSGFLVSLPDRGRKAVSAPRDGFDVTLFGAVSRRSCAKPWKLAKPLARPARCTLSGDE